MGAGLKQFLVLGPIEVRIATNVVDIGGERQRKMLAVLLLNANLAVPVERLVDELWADPPTTARRQVYNGAAALRRQLVRAGFPADTITADAGGYRLRLGAATLDSNVVSRLLKDADRAVADGRHDDAIRLLREAAGTWRGNTLDGLASPLIDSVSARLDEQRVVALERLAEVRLAAGEGPGLVGDLKEYVARYPLRESLRGTMMLALCRSGRQAEALATFDECRHRLAEDLGLDPGPELRKIHAAVLRGGARTAEPAPMPSPTGPESAGTEPVCTSFVPPPRTDFIGRRAEVQQAMQAVDAADRVGRSAVLVIDGAGGVGKTALALHLAGLLRDRFPDGLHFVDLRGFVPHQRPLTPGQALDGLLRQVGLAPGLTASDLPADAARLRAALAGRRVLLLLDDAPDSRFLREMLPSTPGALVLITSRRQLLVPGGDHPISVRPLSPSAALDLFARTCGHNRVNEEPEASREVVRLCGYLPLAVQAAASRLRHRPLWSVTDLAAQLQQAGSRLRLPGPNDRTVGDVLLASYRALPAAYQQLFRALAGHTGPYLSARIAAVLAGLSVPVAEHGLEALADNSLLTPYDRGRYQLHPLLHDLAGELANLHEPDQSLAAYRYPAAS